MSELNTALQAEWVHDVRIPAGEATLEGNIHIPAHASGIVLFAHGSGSSRHSPRNQYVARVSRAASIGALLFDLLTPEVVCAATPEPFYTVGLWYEDFSQTIMEEYCNVRIASDFPYPPRQDP